MQLTDKEIMEYIEMTPEEYQIPMYESGTEEIPKS